MLSPANPLRRTCGLHLRPRRFARCPPCHPRCPPPLESTRPPPRRRLVNPTPNRLIIIRLGRSPGAPLREVHRLLCRYVKKSLVVIAKPPGYGSLVTAPDVESLRSLRREDAVRRLADVIEARAAVTAVLGDLATLPEDPEAELPGTLWIICRAKEEAFDPIAPPYSEEGWHRLLEEQRTAATVVGWTRPTLTCVVMSRGYLLRVALTEDDFMPIARWDLRVLGDACCLAGSDAYPELASAPDATEAWVRRPDFLREEEEPSVEISASASTEGSLGDGWDDLAARNAPSHFDEALITVADHYAIQPVPEAVRDQRLREDTLSGIEPFRGRFEVVDTRNDQVVAIWRNGPAFDRDLATLLMYQWDTPYELVEIPYLYAYRGHIIRIDIPGEQDVDGVADYNAYWGAVVERRMSRPLGDTGFTLVRRIMRELRELEEANRDVVERVVARHLPMPGPDLWGSMVLDAEMKDALSPGQYERWQITQSDDFVDIERHAWAAASGGELTLAEWRQVRAGGPEPEGMNRRVPIPQRVRHEVWRRDEGRCVECGSQALLEFDHIVPWSRGGSDTARNLQLLCEPCNRSKASSI